MSELVTREELRLVQADVKKLNDAAVEHRVRLENGSKVFSGYAEQIQEIDKRTTPRPPSIYKIVGLTLTIVLTGAGALWGLANRLRDRPTDVQIQQIIHEHDAAGHQTIRTDVGLIQMEQSAQRGLIENVRSVQTMQGKKLDTLLERTPGPKKKRKWRR
jgi:hypothetical protein